MRLCLRVCPSVREHLSNRWTDLYEVLARSPVAVARSSSGGVAIRYVLPILWITSHLVVVGRTAIRGRLNLEPIGY